MTGEQMIGMLMLFGIPLLILSVISWIAAPRCPVCGRMAKLNHINFFSLHSEIRQSKCGGTRCIYPM